MDAIMAIIVVFLVIVATRAQMQGANLNYWNSLYAQELGSDIIAVLDEQGVLATLDPATIRGNITALLPQSYEMWAEIESYSYGDGFNLNKTISVGSEPASDDSVVSGKRIFVSGEDYVDRYNLIRFKIWPK